MGRPKMHEKEKRKTIVATVSAESYKYLRRKENGPIGRTIDRILKLIGAFGILFTLQSFQITEASVITVSGIIRCDTATGLWSVLDNSDHVPLHLNYVVASTNKITIGWDFTATRVITLSVSPDEVFAPLGVIAGASVGFSSAVIKVNKPISSLCIESANFFIYGLFEE